MKLEGCDTWPEAFARAGYRTFVTPDWKLIAYQQVGRFQLFDLTRDEHEIEDRSHDPAQAGRLAELKARLAAAQKAAEDTGR